MNFNKFKDIDMPDVKVTPDFEYLEKINKLPAEPKKSKVFAVIGTVAAAILIVVAVSLWAIIGRGMRSTEPTLFIADGADASSGVELDTSEWNTLLDYVYKVKYIPLFDKTQPPSVVEMLDFYNIYLNEPNIDRVFFGKGIKESAMHYFGASYYLEDSRNYQNSGKDISSKNRLVSYEPIAKKIMRYDMADGKYNFVVTYTLNDTTYNLSFISSDIKKDPERFILHTTDKPLKKDYTDEKIFYLLEKKIFSDPNVKNNWLWLTVDDIYKINETLYTAKIGVNYTELHDPSIEMFPFNMEYYPRFFEYVNGELVIAENQNRKSEGNFILKGKTYEWATDKRTVKDFGKYITKFGLVSLHEFEGEYIYKDELVPEREDAEFNITYIVRGETVYGEAYEELWFTYGGKEYVVGFVAMNDGRFDIEYVMFKRENKLYTGNENTTTMQYATLMQSFVQPYSYKAKEIENNIPEKLLFGQSMGIETPNIDSIMIAPYDDGPLKELPEEYYEDLEHLKMHGGFDQTEESLKERYENMLESQLLCQRMYNSRASKDDVARLLDMFINLDMYNTNIDQVEYMNLERYYKNRYGYRYYSDKFTEDELLQLKERGIVPNDIDYLLSKLGTPQKILKTSDKKLKSILTDFYNQKYIDTFGKEYK